LILVVLDEPTGGGAVEKSFRNLPNVKAAYAGGLGVYDVLRADRVVLTTAALDAIEAAVAGTTAEGGEAA
jgi:ribosomal protein L4